MRAARVKRITLFIQVMRVAIENCVLADKVEVLCKFTGAGLVATVPLSSIVGLVFT